MTNENFKMKPKKKEKKPKHFCLSSEKFIGPQC